MAYASPPPYYGLADVLTTPFRSYFNAAPSPRHFGHSCGPSHDVSENSSPGSSYPSPRYASNGRYATNTRITSPFGVYASDVPQPRSSYYTPSKEPFMSSSSFSYASPPQNHNPTSTYRAATPGVVPHDEFIEIDDNAFIHIAYGMPVHRGGKCHHSTEPSKPRPRKETNYGGQNLNYDPERNPFVFIDMTRGFSDIPTDSTPKRSRTRGASNSSPRRQTKSSAKKMPLVIPKATKADAHHQHIPPGYSLKNWDPTESPILLLGSVFDANSLGKWIYDWTVFRHGPAAPISGIAGELWLLLIKSAGKVKRAEEGLGRIRKKGDRKVVADFVKAGEKLTERFGRLLRACEGPMLKARRRKGEKAVLGKNAGVEFVETLFGRERQLEGTEIFMTSCRLWNMRFDANCDEILGNPSA